MGRRLKSDYGSNYEPVYILNSVFCCFVILYEKDFALLIHDAQRLRQDCEWERVI